MFLREAVNLRNVCLFTKCLPLYERRATLRNACCFPKDAATLRKTWLLYEIRATFKKKQPLSKPSSPKAAFFSLSSPYRTNLFSSVFTPLMLLSFSKALSLFCSTDLEKSTIKFSDSFNASFTCSDKTTTSLIPWSMEAV